MTARRDPVRLVDMGSSVPQDLADAIRSMRTDVGSVASAEGLSQRLATKLTVSAPTRGGKLWVAQQAWLVAVFGIGLFGTPFVAPAGSHTSPAALTRSPSQHAAVFRPERATTRNTESSSIVFGPPPPSPRVDGLPRRRRQRHRPTIVMQPTVTAPAWTRPDPIAELALLRRSEAALHADDATTALGLAEQHAKDYPHGIFAQEREVLAIEALRKQHQRDAALQRAQQFIASYSNSLYAFRIHALLDQSPADASSGMHGAPPIGAADSASATNVQ